jgi:hypothetical protein
MPTAPDDTAIAATAVKRRLCRDSSNRLPTSVCVTTPASD